MGNCGAKTNVGEDAAAHRELPSELTLMKKAELKKVLDADSIKREVLRVFLESVLQTPVLRPAS